MRVKEPLFLQCRKQDFINVHCHIVHDGGHFLGTFVHAHFVVLVAYCIVTYVHCV
jgi:hypothetical protein